MQAIRNNLLFGLHQKERLRLVSQKPWTLALSAHGLQTAFGARQNNSLPLQSERNISIVSDRKGTGMTTYIVQNCGPMSFSKVHRLIVVDLHHP